MPTPLPEDLASLRAWFDIWGRHVAAADFAAARPLFDPDVFAFGTVARTMRGLDRLEAEQWREVWPNIAGFRFETALLEAAVSPDRLMAAAAVPWSSTGYTSEGTAFARPGRATAALQRASVDAPWQGVHTHFSTVPGVPGRSFAKPG